MTTSEIQVRWPVMAVDTVLIGSGKHCWLRITDDPGVTAEHARIYREGPRLYWLINQSRHGLTRVMRGMSECQLTLGGCMQLVRGDQIVLGSTWLPQWPGLR